MFATRGENTQASFSISVPLRNLLKGLHEEESFMQIVIISSRSNDKDIFKRDIVDRLGKDRASGLLYERLGSLGSLRKDPKALELALDLLANAVS